MRYKSTRIIIIIAIAFTTLSTACGVRITRNYYSIESKTQHEIDSSNYILQIDSQSHKQNDEQG